MVSAVRFPVAVAAAALALVLLTAAGPAPCSSGDCFSDCGGKCAYLKNASRTSWKNCMRQCVQQDCLGYGIKQLGPVSASGRVPIAEPSSERSVAIAIEYA